MRGSGTFVTVLYQMGSVHKFNRMKRGAAAKSGQLLFGCWGPAAIRVNWGRHAPRGLLLITLNDLTSPLGKRRVTSHARFRQQEEIEIHAGALTHLRHRLKKVIGIVEMHEQLAIKAALGLELHARGLTWVLEVRREGHGWQRGRIHSRVLIRYQTALRPPSIQPGNLHLVAGRSAVLVIAGRRHNL